MHADDTQAHIAKHILKTVCTDVSNILVNFLAADLMMSVENPSTITNEVCVCRSSRQPEIQTVLRLSVELNSTVDTEYAVLYLVLQVRLKILGKLSEETKGPLLKLHNSLNGKVSSMPV